MDKGYKTIISLDQYTSHTKVSTYLYTSEQFCIEGKYTSLELFDLVHLRN